jgi:hypothetical protein
LPLPCQSSAVIGIFHKNAEVPVGKAYENESPDENMMMKFLT